MMMVGKGKPSVSRHLNGRYELIDINISLLRRIAERWKKRNFEAAEEGVVSYVSPFLLLSISVGQICEGETVLLHTERAKSDLTKIEKLLAKRAFTFRRVSIDRGNEGDDIIETLSKQAAQAIKNDASSDYEIIYDRLMSTQKAMLSIGETNDSNNQPFNYAELGLGWRSYAEYWAIAHEPQFLAATDTLKKNKSYFRKCCYLAYRLCNHTLWNTQSFVGMKESINMQANLHYRLDSWWQKSCDTNDIEHNMYQPATTNITDGQIHDDALKRLIEGWEAVLERSLGRKIDDVDDWRQLSKLFDGFQEHLTSSITSTARAVISGNERAVDIWIEHLRRWPSTSDGIIENKVLADLFNVGQSILCNSDRFNEDWVTAKQTIINAGNHNLAYRELTPRNLFNVIKKNLWQDGCMILCAFLLKWASEKSISENKNLPLKALGGLIGVYKRSAKKTYTGFLRSHLRDSWDNGTYPNRLEDISRRILYLLRDNQIAGRIYSDAIPVPLKHIRLHLLYLALACNDVKWIPKELDAILANNDASSHLQHVLNQCFEELNEVPNLNLIKKLSPDPDDEALQKTWTQFRETVNELRRIISISRDEAIRDAPISSSALSDIANTISKNVFDQTKASFPLSQFSKFDWATDSDQLEPFDLKKNSFPKTDIIKDPTSEFPADWHHDVVEQYLSSWLMRDVFVSAKEASCLKKISYQNDNELAERICRLENKFDDKQLFIVAEFHGSQSILFDWREQLSSYNQNKRENLSDIKISRNEKFENDRNYIFNINSLPAFRVNAELGGLLVLPKDLLKKLILKRFENDFPIRISFDEDENDPWHGILTYHWERKVELSDDENLQIYQFVNEPQEDA